MEFFECLEENFENPRLSSTLDDIEKSVEYDDIDNPKCLLVPEIDDIPFEDNKISKPTHFESVEVHPEKKIDELKISKHLRYVTEETDAKNRGTSAEDDIFQNSYDSLFDSSNSNVLLSSTFNDESETLRYKNNRPPDLQILKDTELRPKDDKCNSPVYSSTTPTQSNCGAPPAAMILDTEQKKMAILLQRFGLTRFIFTFLEQEVDLDLFLILNDEDLRQIGIESRTDRNILLSVIAECNRYNM